MCMCHIKRTFCLFHCLWLYVDVCLVRFHRTSVSDCGVHAWVKVVLRHRVLPASPGFTSPFCHPHDILSSRLALFSLYYQVSMLDSAMLVPSTPSTVHRAVKPNCSQESNRRMASELVCGSQVFHFFFVQPKCFFWPSSFARSPPFFSLGLESFS